MTECYLYYMSVCTVRRVSSCLSVLRVRATAADNFTVLV